MGALSHHLPRADSPDRLRLVFMPTNRQHIHCILSEAPEPLFPSEGKPGPNLSDEFNTRSFFLTAPYSIPARSTIARQIRVRNPQSAR